MVSKLWDSEEKFHKFQVVAVNGMTPQGGPDVCAQAGTNSGGTAGNLEDPARHQRVGTASRSLWCVEPAEVTGQRFWFRKQPKASVRHIEELLGDPGGVCQLDPGEMTEALRTSSAQPQSVKRLAARAVYRELSALRHNTTGQASWMDRDSLRRLHGPEPQRRPAAVATVAAAAKRLVALECDAFLRVADVRAERWSAHRRWAGKLDGRDTVVSFNYDCVLESSGERVFADVEGERWIPNVGECQKVE